MTLVLKNAHPLNVTFVLDDDVQGRKNVQSIVDAALHVFELDFHLPLLVDFLDTLRYFCTGRLLALPDFFHYFLGEEHELLLFEASFYAVPGAATIYARLGLVRDAFPSVETVQTVHHMGILLVAAIIPRECGLVNLRVVLIIELFLLKKKHLIVRLAVEVGVLLLLLLSDMLTAAEGPRMGGCDWFDTILMSTLIKAGGTLILVA